MPKVNDTVGGPRAQIDSSIMKPYPRFFFLYATVNFCSLFRFFTFSILEYLHFLTLTVANTHTQTNKKDAKYKTVNQRANNGKNDT